MIRCMFHQMVQDGSRSVLETPVYIPSSLRGFYRYRRLKVSEDHWNRARNNVCIARQATVRERQTESEGRKGPRVVSDII